MPVGGINGFQATKASLRSRAVQEAWRRADAVCFDVDSTLIREEGLDGLAEHCGAGSKVKEWTTKAMGGSVTFQEALKARLDLFRPSLEQVTEFVDLVMRPEEILTPGVESLVKLLQRRGTAVYLVSGGFRKLIEPVAQHLGVPRECIYANRIFFDGNGQYAGFDVNEPTSHSGGKTEVLAQLKRKHTVIVMIGDGSTDMEASPPADAFIGFGGNVVREKVKAGAAWFVYSFQELIDQLAPPENCERKANGFVLQPGLQGARNGAKHQTTDGFADGQICSRRLTNGLTEESTMDGFADGRAHLEHCATGFSAFGRVQPNGLNFRKGACLTGFEQSNSLHRSGCSREGGVARLESDGQ